VEADRGRILTPRGRGGLHRSELGLEIAHEAFEPFLMLGLAEAGQVRIDDRGGRTFVAEVDLNLAQVLSLLQKMGGVGMAQRMDMGVLFDAAFFEAQSKSPLQGGAAHRLVGRGCALATMAFGGKEPDRVVMSSPEGAQMFEGALWQRHVTVAVAFAGADVQEHPARINVGHLQMQPFTQAQTAGVKRDERDAMIQGGDAVEDLAHLLGREDDRQFESGLSPNQFQFRRPRPAKALLPEKFDGAEGLGGSLAGDFFNTLEVDEILAQLLDGDQLRGAVEMLGPLTDTGEVGLLGARRDGQELQIFGEGI